MTPRQIALVKDTWQHVQPHSDAVAERFYTRLFDLDPTLRSLFKKDMRAQGRMVTSVITIAVSQLDRLDKLVPVVRALGQRHAMYGVKDSDYATVGAALLDTLAEGLKTAFTPEVKEAWVTTYTMLADTMKAGTKCAAEAVN